MKNEKKKGITLVELMVVVAIIGVLALLGLKTYSTQQERAIKAITKANLGTIQLMLREREVAGIVSLMNPKQYENKKSSWGLEYLWDQNICELNLAFNWEKYDIQISPVEYFFIINTINSKKTWCLAIGTFVDEIHPNMLMRVSQKINLIY